MDQTNLKLETAEVLGDAIIPVLKGIHISALTKSLLAKHGFEKVQKGEFYPILPYLALLGEVERRMPTVLKEIGRHIFAEAVFPENMNIEQALQSSNQAYYMNHRGCQEGDIGLYVCEKIDKKNYKMSVSTPYPCAFTEGIFLGYAKYFNCLMTIRHEGVVCKTKGHSRCDYLIHISPRHPENM